MAFLHRWWWLLALGAIAAAVPAYFFATVNDGSEPVYQSTSVILVIGDFEASERLTTTYARLIELPPVFAEVRDRLGLPFTPEELDQKTSVSNEFSNQLIEITVEDSDPLRTAQMANMIATVFLERIDVQVGRPGTATVVSAATPADQPEPELSGVVLIFAALLGVLVAASIGMGFDWLGREIEA